MANYCGNCGTQLEEDSVYCPSCGQKVMEENVGIVDEKKFDPMTGKKLKKSKKGKRHIPAIATGILVIVVVAIILVKSGVFLSKSDQVLLALQNTLEESQLIRDLSKIRLVEKNNFTVELDGRLNGYKTNVLYIKDNSNKQIVRNFDDEDNFEVCLLKNDIMFRVSDDSDDVFLYQYRKAPSVKLAEAAGEENIEALNTLIEKIYDEQLGRKLLKKDKDVILKKLRSLEFEKISSKKFDIKNKKRKCKGFSVEISKEDMMDVIQGIYEVHAKEMSDVYEVNNSWLSRIEWKDIEDDLDDNFEDMESEINFYLYKNKLVGIEWETEQYFVEVNLGGEDSILEEIEIVCQEYGQEFADIKVDGKNRDGKEVYEIHKNDMEYANITYDYEDEGKLEIQCVKRGIYLEADLEIKYNKITADVESLVTEYDEFKGTICIKKGGKVEKLEGEQSFLDDRLADYIKEHGWIYLY